MYLGLPFLSNQGEEYKMKPCIGRKAKDAYLRLNYFPWRIRLAYLLWPMQVSIGIQ
jgi:hypothetical protein